VIAEAERVALSERNSRRVLDAPDKPPPPIQGRCYVLAALQTMKSRHEFHEFTRIARLAQAIRENSSNSWLFSHQRSGAASFRASSSRGMNSVRVCVPASCSAAWMGLSCRMSGQVR
jgi:hypothetical protein